MALKVVPGSSITFQIHLANRDTLEPIADGPVYLDRIDQPAAPPIQLEGGVTDASGNVVIRTTVPSTPGSYGYRARTPGLAERFRADTSSQVSVQVPA